MHRELRKQIKEATEKSGINKLDFIALLRLIDQHYDKMEETISQTMSETLSQSLTSQALATTTTTPIEVIFDSVTDALMSVSDEGVIQNCNKISSKYFGLPKNELIGSKISRYLPGAEGKSLADFLPCSPSYPAWTRRRRRRLTVKFRRHAPTAQNSSPRSTPAVSKSAKAASSSSACAM
jgi:transcriptional regulator with PAS, ATPase and Fis domain